MSSLVGFIPAGGLGSRLRPHTYDVPKALLLMGSDDRRLIDFSLQQLSASCEQIYVSICCGADVIADYIGEHYSVNLLRESRLLGNAGAFIEHIGVFEELDPNASILILPSDHVICNLPVGDFLAKHDEMCAKVSLLITKPKPYGEYLIIRDGCAIKVVQSVAPSAFSTTGIYMLRNHFILEWAFRLRRQGWHGDPRNITADLVNPAVFNGNVAVFHLPEEAYWDDAGTPDRYHQNNMLLSGGGNVISRTAVIEAGARLERCVVLGHSVMSSDTSLVDAIVSEHIGRQYVTYVSKPPA